MKHLPPTFELESARCLYRQSTQDDLVHTFSASRHPGFTDGMLWEAPESLDELLPHFREVIHGWKMGSEYCFTIEVRQTKKFVGHITIRHEESTTWNIGFWTHPVMQNQGYMTEAVPSIIRFGFDVLSVDELIARHACWNIASETVLKKSGMTFRQHIPQGYFKRGKWVEENELSIKREVGQLHNRNYPAIRL